MALTFQGTAGSLFSHKGIAQPETGMNTILEASFALEGSTVVQWNDGTGFAHISRFTSTDADVSSWTETDTDVLAINYAYVNPNKINGYYYCIGALVHTGLGSLYAYKSSDGVTWSAINGGNPVLTISASVNSILYQIWNNSFDIDGNGNWHIVFECAANQGASQGGVGLGYSHATISGDNINFDANVTAYKIIPFGGNPSLLYLPDKNALLCIHGLAGDIYAPSPFSPSYWYVTISTASLANDVSKIASWTTHRNTFAIGATGIHVADPDIIQLPAGKNSTLLVGMSYNQANTYIAYADVTLDSLYDTIIASSVASTAWSSSLTAAKMPMIGSSKMAAVADTLTTGLLSYWKLNSNSNDSASTHNGTDTAISYASAGIIGNCATFTRASNSKINIPTFDLNTQNGPWALSMWFKTSSSGGTPPAELIAFGKRDGTNTFELAIGDASSTTQLCLYDWSSGTAKLRSSSALNDGAWHHVVINALSNTNAAMYIDGICHGGAGFSFTSQSNSGGMNIGNYDGNVRAWNGGLDEVATWNRMLTLAEIAKLYNNGAGKTYPL